MKRLLPVAAFAAALVAVTGSAGASPVSCVPLSAPAAPAAAPVSATAAPAVTPSPSARAATRAAAALVASHPARLHVGSSDVLTALPAIAGPGGLQNVPYTRTYRGLPVVGGDFVVTTNAQGAVLSTSSGDQSGVLTLSTSPTLSAAKAGTIALARGVGRKAVQSTKLIVLATPTGSHLAYESLVTGNRGAIPSKLHVVVDASTGAVLRTHDDVAEGTGNGWINGPRPFALATTHVGTTYSMKDPVTTNLSCQNATGNVTFTGPDDVWGNGVSTDRETGCADALFDAQTEVKMLSAWLGRNGMDGAGGAVPIRVGLADVNAYYDGTQVQVGHNNANQWISSLDVVGHEFGHMVDDRTPGGISGNGTQEAVADVFGALSEAYANEPAAYDPPDYSVGEEINLVGSGPIRQMYNPSLVGDPNCYSSSIPTTEVHSAAGPMDHWFYLVAQGSNPSNGNPTSPTCNSTVVGGALGNQTAGKIFYSAMLMKTTGASYLKYRTWTLTAAKNLTPTSCAAYNTVKAAWNAVSVPAQAADPTCTIGGPPVVTNPGARSSVRSVATSLQMTASGGTTPYTWSATGLPAGLTINTSTGLISGTPTTVATYAVTVTATGGGTGSTSFSWAITATGGCSSPGQKLVNPGFESGAVTWTQTAGVIGQNGGSGQPAHGGTWNAWLNGYGTTHTDTLSQSVTVPAGCATTFSFWVHIDTAETTTTTQYDKLTVTAGSTTLATMSNLNKSTGYVLASYNLVNFAGQSVVLKFTGVEDSSLQTSFVIDDAAVTSS